jgi:hypothetical protein
MALVLCLTLAAATSASSGPDLSERATAVTLPIARVMVFSDRARVTRAGTTKWPASRVIKLPDLPGNVMLDSIRVTADGARVVRVEKKPVDRERWSIDEVDAWMKDLEEQGDKIALANGALATARGSLSWLVGLEAAPPVLEKDRLGKALPGLAPDSWRTLQDKLGARRSVVRKTESRLEKELRELHASYEKIAREVSARDVGGFSDRKIEVLVIVDPEAAEGTLTVEYAVPGASWKPTYELFFEPDKKKVELRAAGMVSQATGEAWPDAKLALSTAIPSLGIAMPVLTTWALGDDRQFVPTATARAQARRVATFAPPTPTPRVAELEREADRELLQTRSQQLLALAAGTPAIADESGLAKGSWFGAGAPGGVGRAGGSGAPFRGATPRPMRAGPVARAQPSEMPMPPPPADGDYPMAESPAEEQDERRPSMASKAVSGFLGDVGGFLDDMVDERGPATTSRGLALRPARGWAWQTFADSTLPAVTAGGFDYVYDAPVALTVPSQAQGMRVPLASRSYEVETFFEATPSLAPTAFLKATVKNGSKLPILAGPAAVFVNRAFTGDAQLQTTGPGGVLELPLGADENIRLTRTVIPATKTQGLLFGEEDVTDFTVKIDVGNYKSNAVTVRVIDQLPKTNDDKIKVEIISATQKAVKPPDADGLMYWHIEVKKNATQTLQFTYRITRPKGWRLSQ